MNIGPFPPEVVTGRHSEDNEDFRLADGHPDSLAIFDTRGHRHRHLFTALNATFSNALPAGVFQHRTLTCEERSMTIGGASLYDGHEGYADGIVDDVSVQLKMASY